MRRFGAFLLSSALLLGSASAGTIGVTMSNSKDNFLNILSDSIKAVGNSNSNIQLDFKSAESNNDTQFEQVKGFIEQGVDAIIVNAVADERTDEMQQMAADANIPLVYVNRVPPQTRFPGRVSVVSCNEIVSGRLQMRYLASLVEGKGNVVILRGEDSHPAARNRTAGMKEILAQYPNMKLVYEETANWSRDQAEALVTDLLNKGMQIDVIAANNDEMAIGAIRAYEKAGKSLDTVVIGAVDGTPDALAEMKAGKLEISILQNAAAQGTRSIENAVTMSEGKYAQEFDWIPWEVIIPSNMEKYMAM